MDWKVLATSFALLFVAERGDKTQLAVISLAAKTEKPVPVFIGAAAALVALTLGGAIAGAALTRVLPIEYISKAAAAVFIAMGALMLWGKL